MDRLRQRRTLAAFAGALAISIAAVAVLGSRARATRGREPAPTSTTREPRAWPTPFSVKVEVLPRPEELAPGTLRVLVLGDSVASFLGLALRHRQDEAKAFVAARGVGECSIFAANTESMPGEPPVTTSCSATWKADVDELRPDVTLVVLGGAFLGEQSCDAGWLGRYRARLADLAEAMRPNAGRLVLARVPYPLGAWRHGNMLERVDCFDAMLEETAKASRWETLDLMAHVCPTTACIVESAGQPVRPDGLHFDGVGAEETARWALRELARRPTR